MEQTKIIYMNPEEVTKIDPSLVESVTMTTGSIIKVLDKNDSLNSNPEICEKCHLSKLPKYTTENVFRGRKKDEEEEEIKIEGEATEEKKEVLRGPNGMPLLGDIISGKNIANNNNTNPPVQPKENIQKQTMPIPQPPVQVPQQNPIQPPQQMNQPIQNPQQQRPIIPPNKTPMQRPIMPQPKGPINPSVWPVVPPKQRIIPQMTPRYAPVPPQPPKVMMPVHKMNNNMFIHPGKKHIPFVPHVFRNRKPEYEEEVLCPNCSNEVLCPDCAKEVLCPDCKQKELNKDVLCPDCAKKSEKKEKKKKKEEEEKKKKKEEEELKNKKKEEELKNKRKENEKNNKIRETPKVKKDEKKNENKGKDFDFDNYKYHEVNAKTSKNKKSHVLVKKDGIIIANHDE